MLYTDGTDMDKGQVPGLTLMKRLGAIFIMAGTNEG